MRYLRKMIEQFIIVDNEEWDYVRSKFTKIAVKKGEMVHHAGNVFSEIWFIKSGLARSYFLDMHGRDFTWQLYFRGKSKHGLNHFMDDSVSHYENKGSMLSFEVLEDSVFYTRGVIDLGLITRPIPSMTSLKFLAIDRLLRVISPRHERNMTYTKNLNL